MAEAYTPWWDESSVRTVSTYNFYGLNRQRKASRGEFEEMRNMSSGEYPCLCPQPVPEYKCSAANEAAFQATAAPDSTATSELTGFTGIAGGFFYYNGELKYNKSVTFPGEYEWEIIRLNHLYVMNGYRSSDGSSLIYYYNVHSGELGGLGNPYTDLIVTAGKDKDGNYLETFRFGFDCVNDHTYTDDTGEARSNSTFFSTYAKGDRVNPDIFSRLKVGDEVTISGFPKSKTTGRVWYYNTKEEELVIDKTQDYSGNNTVDAENMPDTGNLSKGAITNAYVKGFRTHATGVLGNTTNINRIYFNLYNKNGESIDFDNMDGAGKYVDVEQEDGTIKQEYQKIGYSIYCSGVSISIKRHAYERIAAHQGSVWGAPPNGLYLYSSATDELEDATADSVNKGLAAKLSLGTHGKCTGLCEYGAYLLAFKEESINVIYGSDTSSYNIEPIKGIGCIDPHSIAVTPDGVIFLSYHGFYITSGGAPSLISAKLNRRYSGGRAFFDGSKYYVNAEYKNAEGGISREMLTYDTRYGTWHKWDNDSNYTAGFAFKGESYIADGSRLYKVNGSYDGVEWSVTSARSYDNTLDYKQVQEIWIYADVSEGAEFTVYHSINGGEFIKHRTFSAAGFNVYRCPVRAYNGTSYRWRIEGTGKVVIYEVELKKYENTGRRFKER